MDRRHYADCGRWGGGERGHPVHAVGDAQAARFADALSEFLLALPVASGAAFYAVEVRHPELLSDDYLAALCAGRATHCIAIHARMPSATEQAR